MATTQMSHVIQHLRKALLRQDGAGTTDGQLLGCFIEHRDETAFASLVRRHGAMVWGVCRRLLPHHDAEDAFQATFLVLVRKADSVLPREMVANWLYGVAHQTALKARATTARRRARERQVMQMPEPAVAEQDLWHDLQPLLDQELSRLREKYRVAIVLCDLEGKTRKEAARQLGCPEGTLAARLARGRVMLAKRLARYGLAVPGGAVAGMLLQSAASASVPPPVVSLTIKAATLLAAGQATAAIGVKVEVAVLTEGVLKAMLLTKIKAVTSVVLLLSVTCFGAGAVTYGAWGARQPNAQEVTPPKPDPKAGSTGVTGEALNEKKPDEDVRLLIDKVLKAYGGEEKLQRLNAFTEKIKDLEAFGGTSTSEYFVQLPDKLRIVTEKEKDGKKDTLIFVWNGKQQWTTKNGVEVESEHPLDYWKDFVRFLGPRAILRLKDPQCRVRLLPYEDKVGGTPAIGFGVHKGPMSSDLSLFLYFDKKTGLLLKAENNDDDTEIAYEDYKTFDGFPIARKMTRSVKTRRAESQMTGKSEVIEFSTKDELDAKLFQKP